MELKPGYEQTEVGVIPEKWGTVPLERASVPNGLVRGPFGGALKKEIFVKDGKKVYEQRNAIYRDATIGNYFINETKFRELKRFAVNPGDFIVSCSGTIGRIFKIPRDAQPGVINQALLKIETDCDVVDSDYFFHYFDWEQFQRRIVDNTHGGAMQNLVGMSVFRTVELAHPPLPEQRAIGRALGDVDSLISALTQLIAKKRNIKQAAMQQLLSGKRRLPGFQAKPSCRQTEVGVIPVDWEVEPLGNIFRFSGGFSASRDQLSSEGHCYLHYGDIHNASQTFIDVRSQYLDIPKLDISLKRISPKSLLSDGDIVFVDASEDDEGTSRHVVVVNKENIAYISGLHTIVAKSKTASLDDGYKRYCFQSRDIKRQFYFYAVGTKVSGISKTNIAKIFMPLPPIPEQRAIAAVLSDMDAEIAALEQRRDKTRGLKQGMMQELLTGKTRLI